MLVAEGGRGLTMPGADLIVINSDSVRGSLEMGSTPCSERYLTMRRRSNRAPDLGETTGSRGASPDTIWKSQEDSMVGRSRENALTGPESKEKDTAAR